MQNTPNGGDEIPGLSLVLHLVGTVAAAGLLLMAGVQAAVVLLRAVFGLSLPALQDLAIYLHAGAILLGLSVALWRNAHVRIVVFEKGTMHKDTDLQVTLAGGLLLTLPFALVLAVLSWPYALRSWQVGEGSADPEGLGAVFVLKFAIVLCGALLAIVALAQSGCALALLVRRR